MKCPHCQKEIDVREMAHIENYPNTVSARIIHCGRQVFMIDGKQGLWSRMPPDKNNPGEAVMAMMNVGKGGKAHKFFPLPKLDALLRPALAVSNRQGELAAAIDESIAALRRDLPAPVLLHGENCACGSHVCYAIRTLTKVMKR